MDRASPPSFVFIAEWQHVWDSIPDAEEPSISSMWTINQQQIVSRSLYKSHLNPVPLPCVLQHCIRCHQVCCCSRGRGTDHCSHPSLWGCGRAQPDHRGPTGALQVPTDRILAMGCSRCLNEGFGAGHAALPPHYHGSAPASAFSVVTPSLKAPLLPGTL